MKEHFLKIRLIVYLKRPCVCHNSGRTSQQKPAIIVLETNLRNFKISNQYGQHTVITKTAGLWECVPDSSYYLNSDIRKCFYYSLTQTWESNLKVNIQDRPPKIPEHYYYLKDLWHDSDLEYEHSEQVNETGTI